MNPNKLNHRQRERTVSDLQAEIRADAAREFDTPEELLRHDAAQVSPPAEVAARLGESIRREAPPTSWWKRLFGKDRA
jgi:hypothetical protein